jgi:hypothetical protein
VRWSIAVINNLGGKVGGLKSELSLRQKLETAFEKVFKSKKD